KSRLDSIITPPHLSTIEVGNLEDDESCENPAIKCRCDNYAVEFVSFTEKNPGRRFVKCANGVYGCGFWEWIDEPISPLVVSVMEARLKKTETRVKMLGVSTTICVVIIILLV
ncbi:hypothetical protein Leryth_013879, partial [Lithospermum erythrorhizon]